MGFRGYLGGIIAIVLAILLAIVGLAFVAGLVKMSSGLGVPVGIVILAFAIILFLYGWYSYKSSKPMGTINVRNK